MVCVVLRCMRSPNHATAAHELLGVALAAFLCCRNWVACMLVCFEEKTASAVDQLMSTLPSAVGAAAGDGCPGVRGWRLRQCG
jgi:hypothetical protein